MADPTEAAVPSGPPPAPGPRRFGNILWAVRQHLPTSDSAGFVWESARSRLSRLTICHVELRSTLAAGNETDGAPANSQETELLRELRAAAVARVGPAGSDVPIVILHGDPGQRICEYADFLGVDLIVLGPREKRTIVKTLRGSVTRYVAGNTHRSVLLLGS